MKPLKLLLTLIVSSILMVSCVSPEKKVPAVNYINDHSYGTDISALLKQAGKSIYRIEMRMVYKVEGKKHTSIVRGVAFAVDTHRLFTAEHLTRIDYYEVNTPFGRMKINIKKEDIVKEWMYIVTDDGYKWPIKVIYRDKLKDFAVLEATNNLVDPIYKIGNSNKFRLLDTVVAVSDFGAGLGARLGHISQLAMVRYYKDGKLKYADYNYFGFTAVINVGDSGSPIFVIRDGQLEVGGITSFIVVPLYGMGYGTKITPAVELLAAREAHKSWVLPLLK